MIKIVYEPDKKRSAAYDKEVNIGECTYSESARLWIIDHTFVEGNYGGQGIASKLVAEIVEQARANNKKIIPLCPFAKKEFLEKTEYMDVLSR
ncbi:MAG: GNAT family N-acetyltransferase [Peptostreptococcus sp.]|uniref:GNAT family N-acetyltransferase n=1 Tax=Peptostreptococcus sp. TaxID=1262 RepID=UPI002FCAECCE